MIVQFEVFEFSRQKQRCYNLKYLNFPAKKMILQFEIFELSRLKNDSTIRNIWIFAPKILQFEVFKFFVYLFLSAKIQIRKMRYFFVIFKHCAFLLLKIRHFSDFLIRLGLYLMSKCCDVISCEALENGLMT